jgi:hypothetical protein
MGCIHRVPAMIIAAFVAPAVFSSTGVADPARKLMMEQFTIDAGRPWNKVIREKQAARGHEPFYVGEDVTVCPRDYIALRGNI